MITLYTDEKTVLTLRRHWFIFLMHILPVIIISVFFIIATIFVANVGIFEADGGANTLFLFAITVLLFFVWLAGVAIWTNYYLDLWIVTDKRIFDIEQHAFFTREVSEFRLDRVQDITVEVRGIIATLLDFGDVHVQTAGRSRDFILKGAPNPYNLKSIISKQVQLVAKSKPYLSP